MKCGGSGRLVLACAVSIALLLGMTACGGGTVGYLWVLAGKSSANTVGNSITGFKIDNYTGNLTEIVNSPFTTGSTHTPVYGVTSSDGRYLYVVNQGEIANSVVQFSVGGDGVLTPLSNSIYNSTGHTPVWMDIGSGYLYVLDAVSPAKDAAGVAPACASLTNPANTAPCGSVQVFTIATDGTGLLTPVTNTSIKVNNVGISYFPTGPAPTRMKYVSGTLLIVNGDGTVTSYAAGTAGQLTATANSTQVLDASASSNITSITSGGNYIYLTDGAKNLIYQYTVASGVLQPVQGSPYGNLGSATNPVWTLTTTDGSTNTFLYVLNSGSSSTLTAAGSISVYQVLSSGRLNALGGVTGNPFPTGANPVCLLVDPSQKYVYSSNGDGTVTGYELVRSEGLLNQLRRGSQFTVAGKPTCLVTSGILS